MKRTLAAAVVLHVCLTLSNYTFAQTSNASVGGFVQDPTGPIFLAYRLRRRTRKPASSRRRSRTSPAPTTSRAFCREYKIDGGTAGLQDARLQRCAIGGNSAARYNFTLEVGAATDPSK